MRNDLLADPPQPATHFSSASKPWFGFTHTRKISCQSQRFARIQTGQ
uniref:Uncharacterized protein n=1 Tax=Candidatus Nitrotoga fabula TaxID=2182327 RepID=A0A2X0RD84_9PROT|nr:protein of unknown function [Candidatus Nitrotoga fabula]